ncbi:MULTISPECIES: nitroreductase family protein [Herpetosiphon]|uniref:nitroreductase family protein n=1 Tax=Herpetosiphon TaxID=64 RepID=UPI00195C7D73|nr:nitroreductase family protein [Herpetosiphon giganteus]MBM7844215.1 nitroreductase [Herpetosiphon giganteus]
MDLLDAIRSRRTTNGPFEDRPLDPAHVRTILEMAACAPSHFNSQPWRFVVIQDQATRMQLADIAGESMQKLMAGGRFWQRYRKYFRFSKKEVDQRGDGILIDNLPAVLKPFAKYIFTERGGELMAKFQVPKVLGKDARKLVAGSPLILGITLDKSEYKPDDLSGMYSLLSLGAVMQTIWLTATSLGIGMQFISTPMEVEGQWEKINKLLQIPEEHSLMVLYRLGYIPQSADRPTIDWTSSQRKRTAALAYANRWDEPFEPTNEA